MNTARRLSLAQCRLLVRNIKVKVETLVSDEIVNKRSAYLYFIGEHKSFKWATYLQMPICQFHLFTFIFFSKFKEGKHFTAAVVFFLNLGTFVQVEMGIF